MCILNFLENIKINSYIYIYIYNIFKNLMYIYTCILHYIICLYTGTDPRGFPLYKNDEKKIKIKEY